MSNIGITTVLLTKIAGVPSAANEFVTSLNRLAEDLQRGDLVAVTEDYVQFSESVLVSVAPSVEVVPESTPQATTPSDPAASPQPPTPDAAVSEPSPTVGTGSPGSPAPAPAPVPAVNLQA